MGEADTELHIPVLLDEVLSHLLIDESGTYVDATFGRGGHTCALLARLGAEGRVVALDRDPEAVAAATALAERDDRLTVHQAEFSRLGEILSGLGVDDVAGVLMDLGVSSPQLDVPERGFSFRDDGPLDMRMNPQSGMSAAQWLDSAAQEDIVRVLRDYGEERFAKRIARAIIAARPLRTTGELADVVAGAVPQRGPQKKHPATRSFQAIRIYINDEFGELAAGLEAAFAALRPGGRLAVISFHSLEDRIVKHWFRDHSRPPPMPRRVPVRHEQIATPGKLVSGAVRPADRELSKNPRARSATLRVLEKSQPSGSAAHA